MESIKNINQEIKTTSAVENEKIITMKDYNKYLNGTLENQEKENTILKIIDEELENEILNFFYYNSLEVTAANAPIIIKMVSYYRNTAFNYELNPDYNILLDYLTNLDSIYYDTSSTVWNNYTKGTPQQVNHYTVHQEQLEFYLYSVLQEYLENTTNPTTPTIEELQELAKSYPLLEELNLEEFFQDVQTAYQELLKDIQETQDEYLQNEFMEDIYLPTLGNVELQIIPELIKNNGGCLP